MSGRPEGPPIDMDRYPLPIFPAGSKVFLAKFPASLAVDGNQFDNMSYEDNDKNATAQSVANVLRWRVVVDASGKEKNQSNARLVKWSDGSMHLFVGTTAMPVDVVDMKANHQYLYARCKGTIQQVAPIETRLVVRPPTVVTNRVRPFGQTARPKTKMVSTERTDSNRLEQLEKDRSNMNSQLESRARRRQQKISATSAAYDNDMDNVEGEVDSNRDERERLAEERLLKAKQGSKKKS
ncbi:RNA polymerase-associated protein LEO1 [Pelomyxa schiedti]|nr:RNA polymerase-associated protein LEO1 [Pelomyxa schiedti]